MQSRQDPKPSSAAAAENMTAAFETCLGKVYIVFKISTKVVLSFSEFSPLFSTEC